MNTDPFPFAASSFQPLDAVILSQPAYQRTQRCQNYFWNRQKTESEAKARPVVQWVAAAKEQ